MFIFHRFSIEKLKIENLIYSCLYFIDLVWKMENLIIRKFFHLYKTF